MTPTIDLFTQPFRMPDGTTRFQVRLDQETLWLTQRQLADLFQKDVRTINDHVANVFAEGELPPEATIRKYRIVQNEGGREVERLVDHYSLNVVIAVGYRVRSTRGTQFRQWATATLQAIARERAASVRDWKVYYIARCFRYERPQAGRYREFTQFGVEWLNPRDPDLAWDKCRSLAKYMAKITITAPMEIADNVQRGLAYYTDGQGMEISIPSLGAQKQVLGAGRYAEGCGFAFGVDRLTLAIIGTSTNEAAEAARPPNA